MSVKVLEDRLPQQIERVARRWGHRELLLEVACDNLDAIRFYKAEGYRIEGSDVRGTGATSVAVRGFYWDVQPVEK